MFDAYELYQGVALRELVALAASPVLISPFRRVGRVTAFIIDERIGMLVKHSTKRLSPWQFTFHAEHAKDLRSLEKAYSSYVTFVCGFDGLVTIDVKMLRQIVSFDNTEQAWVRIDRKPRSLYGLVGNRSELPYKIPRGMQPIHTALED